jgi:hypothetical protein
VRNVFVILGLMIFLTCKQESSIQKPENLMTEDAYMDLFFELELLNIYQDEGASGQTIDSLYMVIFEKYNADTLQFLESHRYFQSRIPEQLQRVDSVIARIERELVPINKLDSLINHLD